MTQILQDGYTWYSFSFVIFCAIIYKYGLPAINGLLDARIAEIKKDLEQSENLRIEAQEMLAQYQRKHRDAVQEAEKILDKARTNAKKYQDKAEADLNDIMKRREEQLEERLKRMEQNAINDIKTYAADLAMNAAKQIVIEKLDKKTDAKLVEQSIGNIEHNVH